MFACALLELEKPVNSAEFKDRHPYCLTSHDKHSNLLLRGKVA